MIEKKEFENLLNDMLIKNALLISKYTSEGDLSQKYFRLKKYFVNFPVKKDKVNFELLHFWYGITLTKNYFTEEQYKQLIDFLYSIKGQVKNEIDKLLEYYVIKKVENVGWVNKFYKNEIDLNKVRGELKFVASYKNKNIMLECYKIGNTMIGIKKDKGNLEFVIDIENYKINSLPLFEFVIN